jgi:hypothetical protein
MLREKIARLSKELKNKTLRQEIALLRGELQAREQDLNETIIENVGRTLTKQNPVLTFMPHTLSSHHGLTPRIPRSQDVAYKEALQKERAKEEDQAKESQEYSKSAGGVLKIYAKLAQALTDSNNSFTLDKWGRKDKDSEKTESDNEMRER